MKPPTSAAGTFPGLPLYCQNNPLIPAGVFPSNWQELYDAIARLPDEPDPTRREEDSFMRLLYLVELEDFYFPATRDLRSALDIVRMILRGLANRKPNAAYWRAHDGARNALVGRESNHTPLSLTVAVSMAIVGISGSGKSTLLRLLLGTLPQVREHDQQENPLLPRYQILWLIVTCPVNRTPRAFIIEFFASIDRLLNSNYSAACKTKETDDSLIIEMASVARGCFLGVLIIDEIQNAVGRTKSADHRLMKLLVRIAETIGVPIIFVGTPQSQDVLNAELADARRMLGPQWLPYSNDDLEWNRFLDALCGIQVTKTKTFLDPAPTEGPPAPGGLREKFYHLTQGIPAIAKSLWGLAQERAIMRGTIDPTEQITPTLLQQTFDEDMRPVAPAIEALRTKLSLDVYEDLLPKELPKPKAWEKDRAKFEQIAVDCYQDALIRTARRKAREHAEDMFVPPPKP